MITPVPDDPYSLADLAHLAGVTPRTVRYYVAQGLLPSPDAAGPNTRYGEGHLARLRLIKRLQRDHLPLAEIRARLERMRDDDIVAAAAALEGREPEPSTDPADTLAFVRSLMRQSGVRPTVPESPAPPTMTPRHLAAAEAVEATGYVVAARLAEPIPLPAAPATPNAALAIPAMAAPAPDANAGDPANAADPAGLDAADTSLPGDAPSPATPATRSTWERLAISPDVEIHVRRPLDRLTNRRVDQLERIARELFDDT